MVDVSQFRVLGVVAFALFMDYLIYGLIVPLTPYSPAGAMSGDQLALLYSAYALGVLAATPLFGFLGERIGYRRPMMMGVALSGTAIILFWLAPTCRCCCWRACFRAPRRRPPGPSVSL